MEIRRCFKCMNPLQPRETHCPVCGREYGRSAAESFALKPGTILDGKYLVGEMLGQGGFGITYIGFDLLLEQKVAIKEYFPMSTGMVSRDNQTTVVWSSAMMSKSGVEKGFDSFLKEARKMARLGGIPGVVGVKSVFIQNETAYIVMDFVEGETLLKKLQREGPMEYGTCVSLLTPIMEALSRVHQQGIIHRDISPDNIMVQPDGQLILLDLGAAKDLELQREDGTVQSSQLVAKHGFSPIEQYGDDGKIGPWTDVYAMSATIYYCCTGILPPSAIKRIEEDTLSCQPKLTDTQFSKIAVGMRTKVKDRPQIMEELLQILQQGSVPKKKKKIKKPAKKNQLPKWLIPAVAACIAVVALLIGVGTAGMKPLQNTYTMLRSEDLIDVDVKARADQPFWGQTKYQRKDVETITFQSTMAHVPKTAWDVSESGDRTVLAWMDGADLYVAADGRIAPNSDASWMFAFFTNLKSIDFGDCFDTSGVTNMGWMFHGCSNLTTLDVSDFDTGNVTNMGGMFEACVNLTVLDMFGFNTSKVKNMYAMFYDCGSLTILDVSGFDTSAVTGMGFMFGECTSLTALDVSGFDTSAVTDMGIMFSGCDRLTNLKATDSRILEAYRNR